MARPGPKKQFEDGYTLAIFKVEKELKDLFTARCKEIVIPQAVVMRLLIEQWLRGEIDVRVK